MADRPPTLAEVLRALERRKVAPPGQVIEALSFADLAEQYFDANREWLERAELERAARIDRGIAAHCPVLIVPGSASKPTTGSTQYRGGAPLVIVGADWKPEVQGG